MKVGIIGLGLIGGSLGLTLRSLGWDVLGVSRNPQTCEAAVAQGVVDRASVELSQLKPAEIIFICTPMGLIVPIAQQLVPWLSPATIVTDVGSVKTPIVESLAPIWPNFVGGHPMAGTAAQGLGAAQLGLFKDRPYVLTPVETTPPESLEQVTKIVRSLQAKVYHCSPQDHDRAVALISHLPVFVSAGLIATCTDRPVDSVQDLAQKLASSGFADTSRVGGGNPELGRMMAQYNREALRESLLSYRQGLDRVLTWIENEDWAALDGYLQKTQQGRPKFL
ncbi:prephenate/arogenate dehydrogenase [Roseofilum sp. BLCC_M91]|uniref:Prephenate/arogenate dehydrogenase n=1 Tax=Roseofilum halophilum BLCC-M91 TaxID=3022259 RepID=A0ABT7BHH7_9CYAN|nr:prephenate/arogenate dehydrogenase [Roseofilum halophilum]MDJ1178636.1 prephenate/arogenate dehydrogenase [Roseofilum halophilum BLCC-M91]